MTDPAQNTLWLHDRVGRVRAGDRAAADELVRAVSARLERLARRMLHDFPGVRAAADTADVLQGALVRLVNALRELRPDSTRDFVSLAALQVRRELIDLARHFAARGHGRHVPDPMTAEFMATEADSPADLELWTRFHEAVEELPAEEREVVGLLFYHGYTRGQAALLLGVSERTVYRWWDAACLRLNERLGGQLPAA
ncbi:MAG: sigma-70 family RNA polymerase sigma factor [Gemmataceae bacterium]|nr:sigma-70 family RNA polymerase sigma factor [Gemmataceae bacterium]